MTPRELRRQQRQLEKFLKYCTEGMGRAERRDALGAYLRGLLLDGERKSIQSVARRLACDAGEVQAVRQRLQQAVVVAKWDERELFRRVAKRVDEQLPGVDAFVIDDTGFPKKGRHSVGVQRQYSGTMGRIDNCQVATSLHLASEAGGACIGMRLFVPESWATDDERRAEVGMPDEIEHKPKRVLAMEMLDHALEWGLPRRPVLADAGYGDSTEFRRGLEERELEYVVRVSGTAVVWPPGTCPKPPPKHGGRRGRPRTKWNSPKGVEPVSIASLAEGLPSRRFRRVTWREGTRGPQTRRFVALRIRTAHRHSLGRPPGDEQWLLCEWSFSKQKPTAFYLSNLPANTTRKRLVYLAKLRWRIERDYQELKGELGLDHFEGRTWSGFHHHVALVAAAHAFLTLQRALSPPQQSTAPNVPGLSRDASGDAPADARSLPNVRPHHRRTSATARTVAHVIR